MADILIPNVPDDLIAAIDIKAQRLGISRADYLRQVLARELAVQQVHVSMTDLVDLAGPSQTLATPTHIGGTIMQSEPGRSCS